MPITPIRSLGACCRHWMIRADMGDARHTKFFDESLPRSGVREEKLLTFGLVARYRLLTVSERIQSMLPPLIPMPRVQLSWHLSSHQTPCRHHQKTNAWSPSYQGQSSRTPLLDEFVDVYTTHRMGQHECLKFFCCGDSVLHLRTRARH